MEEQQGSSSVDIDNLDTRATNFDSDTIESPTVTLTTPFSQSAIRTHAATFRKLLEAEKELKAQQRKIQELIFNLEIQDAHLENLVTQRLSLASPPFHPQLAQPLKPPDRTDSRRSPNVPRILPIKQKLKHNKAQKKQWVQRNLKKDRKRKQCLIFFNLLQKSSKTTISTCNQVSDVTDPTKFNGLDTQWDDFYLQ